MGFGERPSMVGGCGGFVGGCFEPKIVLGGFFWWLYFLVGMSNAIEFIDWPTGDFWGSTRCAWGGLRQLGGDQQHGKSLECCQRSVDVTASRRIDARRSLHNHAISHASSGHM